MLVTGVGGILVLVLVGGMLVLVPVLVGGMLVLVPVGVLVGRGVRVGNGVAVLGSLQLITEILERSISQRRNLPSQMTLKLSPISIWIVMPGGDGGGSDPFTILVKKGIIATTMIVTTIIRDNMNVFMIVPC